MLQCNITIEGPPFSIALEVVDRQQMTWIEGLSTKWAFGLTERASSECSLFRDMSVFVTHLLFTPA